MISIFQRNHEIRMLFAGEFTLARLETRLIFSAAILVVFLLDLSGAHAAARKNHSIVLGAVHHEAYSKDADPAGYEPGETSLPVRALMVNGALKEWTTGDARDVTERSFVVRRAIRLNNSLPGDKQEQWVWQRGPWILVDRVTGHITALKLPDYDPAVSRVVWFRDYAAYCGVTPSGKSLYAVVAQLAVRKPVLSKKLSAFDRADHSDPACGPAAWQRNPIRITFQATGKEAVSYDIVPGSAMLVEDSGDEDAETPTATPVPAPASAAKPEVPPAKSK
jgi:hypothetical protein